MRFFVCCLSTGVLGASAAGWGAASGSSAPGALDLLQRADGAQIVPERFLRRWDPVTVFFNLDTGPAAGGPEDAPEKYVTIAPAQAGSWQWLGPRVLQ